MPRLARLFNSRGRTACERANEGQSNGVKQSSDTLAGPSLDHRTITVVTTCDGCPTCHEL
eukprot:9448318-Pyramimonas_sp.AAC.1